jgi:hypothetical protein
VRWEERLGVAVRWEEADWGRARLDGAVREAEEQRCGVGGGAGERDGGANEERVRVPEGEPRDRFEPSDRSHSSFG